jgi:hypothetical protein
MAFGERLGFGFGGAGKASHFVDIPISPEQRTPIRFTFLWAKHDRWEGIDYEVAIESN